MRHRNVFAGVDLTLRLPPGMLARKRDGVIFIHLVEVKGLVLVVSLRLASEHELIREASYRGAVAWTTAESGALPR